MDDLISRQAAITKMIWYDDEEHMHPGFINTEHAIKILEDLPSALPERLTDAEQRIFLAAMEREKAVCAKVDMEQHTGEPCEGTLVHICKEIVRKVKGALWN